MADYWNYDESNPLKPPWGAFDPNAQLDIPFNWSEWLALISETIAAYEIECEPPLQVVSHSESGGVVTAFIEVGVGGEVEINRKYWVTCHIVTTGPIPREDDRTVYLKMVER